MKYEEIARLQCGISLLTDFEDAEHAFDWEVGKHGIQISFDLGDRSYSATYLPEVAPEQGWNQLECLQSLVRKAGYNGELDQNLVESISLVRYQSSKCTLSYADYLQLRGSN
eukprot:TRINITY_DN6365_c0_g1_i2.p1 TRINITY_DN6365_c0_g1~~TRINITY_DN6365_c0_g1_i2.p1  ORF type:complete len:112 (-),score=18.88 TRINITY_DN6365_c0_g1_i2:13-348(-)